MKFLTTLLTATAVCAVLLAAIGYRVGNVPPPEPWAGLTTATVLGSDGSSDGGDAPLDRRAFGRLVDEASQADRGGTPSPGSQG